IGNIALVFLGCAVVPVGIIKVIVSPIIGSLLYTSPAVAHHLLKATVLRTEWIIVSQMPFTEHAGGVSVLRKHLRQQGFVFKQQGTSGNGMPGSYPVGISSGHQGAARGSAGGRHMKVGGSQGLTEKAIEVRRFDDLVAMVRNIAVPLIVGYHQDDIGRSGCACVLILAHRRGRAS